jgi:DNA (cytosine-5)-methyltransferase 1
MMKVIDLFAGCGGLSLGFQQAGFDVIAAFDHWQPVIDVYKANFMHPIFNVDLSEIKDYSFFSQWNPDVIIGGPPCQDFSDAGKRTEGEKANLTYKFSEIVTRIKPRFFVMENVPRARTSEAFSKAKEQYKKAGYGLTEVLLDANKCGVPQKRKRFFCIGALNTPQGFLYGNIFKHYTSNGITVRDYFDKNGYTLNIDVYYRHPTTYARKGIYSVDKASPTIRGVNRPKPASYNRHPNDDVAEEKMANVRQLTRRERAYIQTFPDDFIFESLGIANSDVEQMIGNAEIGRAHV